MEGVGCWWKGEDDIVIMCTDAPTRWNCRYIGPGCICQIWTLRWTLYYLGYFLVSVEVVEHINNSREPIQEMEAIYFISPSPSSVNKLISDFRSPKSSLYKKAHIYFTEGILRFMLIRFKMMKWLLCYFCSLSRQSIPTVGKFSGQKIYWNIEGNQSILLPSWWSGKNAMKHDSWYTSTSCSCVKHERLKTYPSRPLHLIRVCPWSHFLGNGTQTTWKKWQSS